MFEPITYQNKDPSPEFDDDRKAEEAKFYQLHLDCQLMAEWFKALAESPTPWYPAEKQLEDWPVEERMVELIDRPDLRLAHILGGLAANLPPIAFRDMSPSMQANLLDRIRKSGERSAFNQVQMFCGPALMVHTNRARRYDQLVARINWDDNSQQTKAFLATVIQSCLEEERRYEDESGAIKFHERPIDPLALLRSIKALDYVRMISSEELAEIMDKRLEYRSRKKDFTPEDELRIVTIDGLLKQLPTSSFQKIFNTIREKLSFPEPKKPEAAKLDEPLAEGWQAPAAGESKPGEGDSPKGL